MRLNGFTLSEVLITLGIIGIIAAMTLPAILAKHRKVVIETSLKKFYTIANQAILLSVVDNESTQYWIFPEEDTPENVENFYNTYFKGYLNTLQTGIFDYDDGATRGKFTIFLNDGSGVRIAYKGHDWYYCINAKYLEDFSEFNGSKCFLFGFYPTIKMQNIASGYVNRGIEPYIGSYKTDEDGNRVETTMDDLYTSKWYAKIIQLNNWTIPDDYPVRY